MKIEVLTQMVDELRKAPQVALFSHVSPDGDCLGSMLAIGLALEKLGKDVVYYNSDPIPLNLRFLPGIDKVQTELPDPLPQTLLFVDCSDLGRVDFQPEGISEGTTVLNLDHHISNHNFGTLNLVDPGASASGEIVLKLIRGLQVEVDADIATNLYTAIVTDTGSFQFSNTTAETHRLAAELFEQGIDIEEIHYRLYDQKPLAQVELLRRGLSRLKLYAGGKLAIMTLSRTDFHESGADESLSEGLVNHARTIQGVEVAVFLKEVEERKIRASLRSNRWFDVNLTAARFGGGGHKRAAGCTINTLLDEAEQLMVEAIEEEIQFGRSH